MANWLPTRAEAVLHGTDAPADDEGLALYLEAAKEACLAYAPTPADPEDVPESWVLAQAYQARNIYNSGQAGAGSGDFDGGGYGLSTHPLDWQIKQLLRPRRGLGAIL